MARLSIWNHDVGNYSGPYSSWRQTTTGDNQGCELAPGLLVEDCSPRGSKNTSETSVLGALCLRKTFGLVLEGPQGILKQMLDCLDFRPSQRLGTSEWDPHCMGTLGSTKCRDGTATFRPGQAKAALGGWGLGGG